MFFSHSAFDSKLVKCNFSSTCRLQLNIAFWIVKGESQLTIVSLAYTWDILLCYLSSIQEDDPVTVTQCQFKLSEAFGMLSDWFLYFQSSGRQRS